MQKNNTLRVVPKDIAKGGICMKCPKCKSENVKIEIVQMGEVTKKHGNGLGGNMNNAARGITALCTFGMSNLVWKKSTGSEKTTAKNAKIAVCQDCGHSWEVR